jgi:hypothetical protein
LSSASCPITVTNLFLNVYSKTVGYTFKAPADWDVLYKEADEKKGYSEFDYNFVFTPKLSEERQSGPDEDNFAMIQIQFPGNYEFTHTSSESVKTTIEGEVDPSVKTNLWSK